MYVSEKAMLALFIELLENYPVEFPTAFGDPLRDALLYISGEVDDKFFILRRDAIWNYLESGGMFRDMQNQKALAARIALSMFPDADPRDRAEDIDWMMWFFECYGHPKTGSGS